MSDTAFEIATERQMERPFPWRCPHCRQKSVSRVTIPYQRTRVFAGCAIELQIADLAVPRCEECGELAFDYRAEEQINDALRAFIERMPTAPTVPSTAQPELNQVPSA